ncbi:conserved hypothetical protein, partial [delta proteobacterium NaphS2]
MFPFFLGLPKIETIFMTVLHIKMHKVMLSVRDFSK